MTETSNIGRRRAAAKAKNEDEGVYRRRRQEIAEAAARVFNQRGLQGTSISAVAEELNIDRASVYYYVSSKEELFDEVIREASEVNIENARRIQQSKVTPREKLRQLIVELMKSYESTYPLLYIYIRENLRQVKGDRSKWAKHMSRINRDYDKAVISIVEEGYADGSFRYIGPANIVAFGILGAVNWTNRWFKPEDAEVNAEAIGEMYADLMLAGLESRPATTRSAKKTQSTKRSASRPTK